MSDPTALYPGVARKYLRMPHVEPGMTVGLFGGSFNPPHKGHILVTEIAIRRLKLDQLWWLVTPGNPLKDTTGLPPLANRIAWSEAINSDPRVKVTAFEASHDVRFTADTLAIVRRYNPGVRFVWIMGADNLASFHRWQNWRDIALTFPSPSSTGPGRLSLICRRKWRKPSNMPASTSPTRRCCRRFRHLPGLSCTGRVRRSPRRRFATATDRALRKLERACLETVNAS
jgi:hypothetical protein